MHRARATAAVMARRGGEIHPPSESDLAIGGRRVISPIERAAVSAFGGERRGSDGLGERDDLMMAGRRVMSPIEQAALALFTADERARAAAAVGGKGGHPRQGLATTPFSEEARGAAMTPGPAGGGRDVASTAGTGERTSTMPPMSVAEAPAAAPPASRLPRIPPPKDSRTAIRQTSQPQGRSLFPKDGTVGIERNTTGSEVDSSGTREKVVNTSLQDKENEERTLGEERIIPRTSIYSGKPTGTNRTVISTQRPPRHHAGIDQADAASPAVLLATAPSARARKRQLEAQAANRRLWPRMPFFSSSNFSANKSTADSGDVESGRGSSQSQFARSETSSNFASDEAESFNGRHKSRAHSIGSFTSWIPSFASVSWGQGRSTGSEISGSSAAPSSKGAGTDSSTTESSSSTTSSSSSSSDAPPSSEPYEAFSSSTRTTSSETDTETSPSSGHYVALSNSTKTSSSETTPSSQGYYEAFVTSTETSGSTSDSITATRRAVVQTLLLDEDDTKSERSSGGTRMTHSFGSDTTSSHRWSSGVESTTGTSTSEQVINMGDYMDEHGIGRRRSASTSNTTAAVMSGSLSSLYTEEFTSSSGPPTDDSIKSFANTDTSASPDDSSTSPDTSSSRQSSITDAILKQLYPHLNDDDDFRENERPPFKKHGSHVSFSDSNTLVSEGNHGAGAMPLDRQKDRRGGSNGILKRPSFGVGATNGNGNGSALIRPKGGTHDAPGGVTELPLPPLQIASTEGEGVVGVDGGEPSVPGPLSRMNMRERPQRLSAIIEDEMLIHKKALGFDEDSEEGDAGEQDEVCDDIRPTDHRGPQQSRREGSEEDAHDSSGSSMGARGWKQGEPRTEPGADVGPTVRPGAYQISRRAPRLYGGWFADRFRREAVREAMAAHRRGGNVGGNGNENNGNGLRSWFGRSSRRGLLPGRSSRISATTGSSPTGTSAGITEQSGSDAEGTRSPPLPGLADDPGRGSAGGWGDHWFPSPSPRTRMVALLSMVLLIVGVALGVGLPLALSGVSGGGDDQGDMATTDYEDEQGMDRGSDGKFGEGCSSVVLSALTTTGSTYRSIRYEALRDILLSVRASPIKAFDTRCSPQDLALTYLADSDPLKLSIDLSSSNYSAVAIEERYALLVLYYSTHDQEEGWKNERGWLTGDEVCTWEGVICSRHLMRESEDGVERGEHFVSKLDLRNNNLGGLLPSELRLLKHLESLLLDDNRLRGTIPTHLGSLSSLVSFSLFRNQLTGPVPSALGKLSKLIKLDLGINKINGVIPTEISSLTNLMVLEFSENQLTGKIPSALGKLSKLTILGLIFNELTGTIPSQLTNFPNMIYFNLGQNKLTGSLPTYLGKMTSLEELHIWDNNLKGTIPYAITSLPALKLLSLDKNVLSGTIPTSIGKMSSLEELYLQNNRLDGFLPREIGNLSELGVLNVNNNKLSGTLFEGIGNLTKMHQLSMGSNILSGTIPAEVAKMTSLYSLDLSNNKISGTLPGFFFAEMPRLALLHLGDNNLVGTVPDVVCNAVNNNPRNRMEVRKNSDNADGMHTDIVCACCVRNVFLEDTSTRI